MAVERSLDALAAREAAIAHLEGHGDDYRQWLEAWCRIPSVSAEGFPVEPMRRSAQAAARWLEAAGLERVEVVELPGVHPYVCGERIATSDRPTLLLYGHHDVQPLGDPRRWLSPAFEPEVREGRLYARGAIDDKGGVVAWLAAIHSWLCVAGDLPCNVKVVVDGEEEVGSPHLPSFLSAHRSRVSADALVVLDTPNLDLGKPAITCSLRGLCVVDVEVRVLRQPIHSGRGAGVVPDPIQVLSRLIAGLHRRDGGIGVPGFYREVRRLSRRRTRMGGLPFDEQRFRAHSGLLPEASLAGEQGFSVHERLWSRPSLTVIGLDAPPILGSSNQIVDSARARLSLRIVPDMDPAAAGQDLVRHLMRPLDHGAEVRARVVRTVPWWSMDPSGPYFEAAERAMAAGYGEAPSWIGSGGSIGFIEAFTRLLEGVPAILLGFEDPSCNAHSENESLHLGEWKKAATTFIHLFDEVSRIQGPHGARLG